MRARPIVLIALALTISSCSSPWGSLRERSSQCVAGRRDCDGDPANGCEVDTDVSREHCGACGRRATVACVQARPLDPRLLAGAAGTMCVSVAGDSLGGVRCWGSNTHNQVAPEAPATVRATPTDPTVSDTSEVHSLTVGDGFGCAIRGPSRTLRCWGNAVRSIVPDGLAALESVVGARMVAAGARHACVALPNPANDRTVIQCFGDNDRGQLGGERTAGPFATVKTGTGAALSIDRFAGIVAGAAHTCAYSEQQIVCWGANDRTQLGRGQRVGSFAIAAANVAISDNFSMVVHDVAAGGDSTCAVVSTTRNGADAGPPVDAATDATADARDAATAPGDSGVGPMDASVDGGQPASTCGEDQSARRRVLCWGALAADRMCSGRQVGAVRTESGAPLEDVERVFVGDRHACAIQQSGAVLCWGDGADGRLADGTPRGPMVAVPIESLRSARTLSIVGAGNVLPQSARTADREGFCALFDETVTPARVKCWGPNTSNQLGDETFAARLSPTPLNVRW